MKVVTVDLLRVFLDNLKKNFTAPNAKTAEKPDGFAGRSDNSSLGEQRGSCITEWHSENGAGIAFREQENAVNVVTSGRFYSGKGEHTVLDSGNYEQYLPVGAGGTGSPWNIDISGKAHTAENAQNDDLGRRISETYVTATDSKIQGDLHVAGDIYANRVHNVVYNDYAEFFEKGKDSFEPGDIVALDESADKEQYVKASRDSKVVVGVCSDEYAQIIGGTPSKLVNEMNYVPVALAGRVHVKVTGYVEPGDKIVASDTLPGVGMADDGSGRPVVGIALSKKKDGKVRMLVDKR